MKVTFKASDINTGGKKTSSCRTTIAFYLPRASRKLVAHHPKPEQGHHRLAKPYTDIWS